MRKTVALFLTIIYTCCLTGPLWSAPLSSNFVIEKSVEENNKEQNEPEPCKDLEAPHFSRVVKKLPVKIKLSRAYHNLPYLKKSLTAMIPDSGKFILGGRHLISHSAPLFIKNQVFRI